MPAGLTGGLTGVAIAGQRDERVVRAEATSSGADTRRGLRSTGAGAISSSSATSSSVSRRAVTSTRASSDETVLL